MKTWLEWEPRSKKCGRIYSWETQGCQQKTKRESSLRPKVNWSMAKLPQLCNCLVPNFSEKFNQVVSRLQVEPKHTMWTWLMKVNKMLKIMMNRFLYPWKHQKIKLLKSWWQKVMKTHSLSSNLRIPSSSPSRVILRLLHVSMPTLMLGEGCLTKLVAVDSGALKRG